MPPARTEVRGVNDYALGDLVMAKCGEHPYWPAEIRKCHQRSYAGLWKLEKTEELWCQFINEDCGAWVNTRWIKLFEPDTARRWKARKAPYHRTQPKAINLATEIYERRVSRGADEPNTPPPDPVIVDGESEDEEEDEMEEEEEEAPKRKKQRRRRKFVTKSPKEAEATDEDEPDVEKVEDYKNDDGEMASKPGDEDAKSEDIEKAKQNQTEGAANGHAEKKKESKKPEADSNDDGVPDNAEPSYAPKTNGLMEHESESKKHRDEELETKKKPENEPASEKPSESDGKSKNLTETKSSTKRVESEPNAKKNPESESKSKKNSEIEPNFEEQSESGIKSKPQLGGERKSKKATGTEAEAKKQSDSMDTEQSVEAGPGAGATEDQVVTLTPKSKRPRESTTDQSIDRSALSRKAKSRRVNYAALESNQVVEVEEVTAAETVGTTEKKKKKKHLRNRRRELEAQRQRELEQEREEVEQEPAEDEHGMTLDNAIANLQDWKVQGMSRDIIKSLDPESLPHALAAYVLGYEPRFAKLFNPLQSCLARLFMKECLTVTDLLDLSGKEARVLNCAIKCAMDDDEAIGRKIGFLRRTNRFFKVLNPDVTFD